MASKFGGYDGDACSSRDPLTAIFGPGDFIGLDWLSDFLLQSCRRSANYGGMTSGPRWFFWLIPLWLVALIPAADWSAHNWRRKGLIIVLLFFSVLSASYPHMESVDTAVDL